MPSLVLVWAHVLSAITWIGGMVFVGAVLAPIACGMPPRERAAILHAAGVRFSAAGWVSIGLLLVTGPWMLAMRGRLALPARPAALAATAFGRVLLAKLGMILVMVLLSVLHDFIRGPRLVAALASETGREPVATARPVALWKRVATLARVNLALGVLVVGLGVVLAWR